ncbi:aluminum-activated malate transporter 10-like [Populus nigra]|uniref:aluminum-activated malate transporter 10-like n=1 Tax=Populus nigra TaxID=3691 RepID=UPI002B270266|nr:aluminum-activated malate transporter 10-like [Populus nigra]
MVMGNEVSNILEWRINVPDGTLEILQPEHTGMEDKFHRIWLGLKGLLGEFILKIWKFLEKARNIAVAEPKKVIHCLKVGMELSIVSLFYYMRPLYEGVRECCVGDNDSCVARYIAGATLYKCISRGIGTFLAGSLGVGVHWAANHSGVEPIILGISVFLLGYREDKVIDIAHQRLSAIAIGASLCILISMLFYPIWAGEELHNLIHRNLEKLADALDGCIAGYFTGSSDGDSCKKMEGYKFVLNSKAAEDSMAGFTIWEPAHGRFNFRHPWNQYLKAPEHLKRYLSDVSNTLSSYASHVLKELAVAESLPNHLVAAPSSTSDGDATVEPIRAAPSVMEILGLATLVPMLTETAARIEEVADEVNELAKLADLKPPTSKKANQSQPRNKVDEMINQ